MKEELRQLQKRNSNPSNPLPPPPQPVHMDSSWLADKPSLSRISPPRPRHSLHAIEGLQTRKPGAELKIPSMVRGALPSERVLIDENLYPHLAEQAASVSPRYIQQDAEQTPTRRSASFYAVMDRREGTSFSSREEQAPEPEPQRPPRSQPRPFANAAAIESLPPAQGLGLLNPIPHAASSGHHSYTPELIPGPSSQPFSSVPTPARQSDPGWGLQRPYASASTTAPPFNEAFNALAASSATNPYSQPAMLSDLNLGSLAVMPAPIAVPARNISAASSLGDLGIPNLRDIPAPATLPDAPTSRNSSRTNVASSRNSSATALSSARNVNESNVSLTRSQSSSEGPRPIVSALASSRNVSSASVEAPRIQRRRVSFDPDTQTIRRVDADDGRPRAADVFAEPSTIRSFSRGGGHRMDVDELLPGGGLGLAISTGLSSGQVINGFEDLNRVNRSLSSLTDSTEDRHETRHDRRTRGSRNPTAYAVERSPSLSPVMSFSSGALASNDRHRPSTSTTGTLGGIYRDTRSSSRISLAEPRPIPIASPRPVDVRPPTVTHMFDRDSDSTPIASSSSSSSSRRRARRRDSMSTAAAEVSFETMHGGLSSTSLLLNFNPVGPGTSEATTADGHPSSIHAPRPSRHGSNNPAAWLSRNVH